MRQPITDLTACSAVVVVVGPNYDSASHGTVDFQAIPLALSLAARSLAARGRARTPRFPRDHQSGSNREQTPGAAS